MNEQYDYNENFEYYRENKQFRVYIQIEAEDSRMLHELMKQIGLVR